MFTALSDEVNSELDVKWSEMKSYDEGGSSLLFLALLAAMVALACFNIWRKLRRQQPQSVLNAKEPSRLLHSNMTCSGSLFIERKNLWNSSFTPRP